MIQELKAASTQSRKKNQHPFIVAALDLPRLEFRGRLLNSIEELEQLAPAWNRLAEMAIRKNPYFDPDFLIPAINAFAENDV